MKEDVDITE